jgi:hypothetical protein
VLTNETVESLRDFVDCARSLKGDEKGGAQVFCDRLFRAFGHEGYKEAGAALEHRVRKKGRGTKFADLVWRPRLLLEMKKREEKLERHYSQAFDYWLQLVPQNFRELYRTLELPGRNPLKAAHDALDSAVSAAYGMGAKEDPLTFLLALNTELADREADGQPVVGPGLPPSIVSTQWLVSEDRITVV